MLSWLESQETLVTALIVFAFCYLLAALIFVGVAVLARTPIASALQVTTPAMLTPLGVILGLVIAFLAARVWANVDHAHGYVAEEVSGLRHADPDVSRATVRKDHKVHKANGAMLLLGGIHLGRTEDSQVMLSTSKSAERPFLLSL